MSKKQKIVFAITISMMVLAVGLVVILQRNTSIEDDKVVDNVTSTSTQKDVEDEERQTPDESIKQTNDKLYQRVSQYPKLEMIDHATDESFIYIAGTLSNGSSTPYIEKHRKSDKSFDKQFGAQGALLVKNLKYNHISQISVKGEYLYIVYHPLQLVEDERYTGITKASGQKGWVLEKRNKNTGELVKSFGNDGRITSMVSGAVKDFAVGQDSIYLGGYRVDDKNDSHLPPRDLWLEKRHLADGSLDKSFGSGGSLTTQTGKSARVVDIELDQNNGYLYAVSYTGKPHIKKRELISGKLAESFGDEGKIVLPDEYDLWISKLSRHSDFLYVLGNEVISGHGSSPAGRYMERRNLNGSYDKTFAKEGILTGDDGGSETSLSARSVEFDSDFMYIASFYADEGFIGLKRRFIEDGRLDTSFGNEVNHLLYGGPSLGIENGILFTETQNESLTPPRWKLKRQKVSEFERQG